MAETRATIKKNQINVKDYRKNIVEYKAGAAISPGQLVKISGDTVIPFSAATDVANSGVGIALEDETWGKSVTDNYKVNARVRVWYPLPGDEGLMRAGAAAALVKGDTLASDTAGKVVKGTTAGAVVGVSLEAFTPAVDGLVHVRFV